jgi:hypothetical protein
MNYEDFKKLSRDDAFVAAGQIAGVEPSVFDGMWRTESARGERMLSPAGAEGHFQLMNGTRKVLESRFGASIDPYNFNQSLFAAAELMRENLARFKNLPDALRAYNNGWDKSKWDNPETAAYAAKVLGDDAAAAAAGDYLSPGAHRPTADDVWNRTAQGKQPKAGGIVGELARDKYQTPFEKQADVEFYNAAGAIGLAASRANPEGAVEATLKPRMQAIPNVSDATLVSKAASEYANGEAQAESQRDPLSFMDKSRAVARNNGLQAWLMRSFTDPQFPAEAGYAPPHAELAGHTYDEQNELLEARSQKQFEYIKHQIEFRREDERNVMANGTGVGVLASLFGGSADLPSWAAGFGVMKGFQAARIGSMALAQAGRGGAAMVSAVAENVLGNVAAVGVEDLVAHNQSLTDYAMGAGMGLIPGLAAAHIEGRAASKAAQEALAHKVMREAMEKHVKIAEQAKLNLGETATREQLLVEMQRLEAEDLRATVTGATAPLPENRRLLPEMAEEHETPKAAQDFQLNPDEKLPTVSGHDELMAPAGQMNNFISMAEEDFNAKWMSTEPVKWDDGLVMSHQDRIAHDLGVKYDEYKDLGPGVHYLGDTSQISGHQKHVIEWLQKHFAPDRKILIKDLDLDPNAKNLSINMKGDAGRLLDKANIIRARFADGEEWQHTIVHEFGHAIQTKFMDVPTNVRQAFMDLHAEWQAHYTGAFGTDRMTAAQMRGSVTSHAARQMLGVTDPVGFQASMMDVMSGAVQRGLEGIQNPSIEHIKHGRQYIPNADEFTAEQFTKYIEAAIAKELDWKPASIPQALVDYVREMWGTFVKLVTFAKDNRLIKPDERAVDFFESIRKQSKATNTKTKRAAAGLNPERDTATAAADMPTAPRAETGPDAAAAFANDPIAIKYNLHLLPQGTDQQRAEAKAMLHLYKKADAWAATNPIDEFRLKSLTDNSVFNVASTGMLMLKSQNPVVRMVASELLESASGAAGRRSTAAIAKYMNEGAYMGNAINDVQRAYKVWRNAQGIGVANDMFKGTAWQRFNRDVAAEIEGRLHGTAINSNPAVIEAANVMEQAYERMRIAQTDAKTPGWAALPGTAKGYMPHRMSPEKVINMTRAQSEALHQSLMDQFISIEGFDITFSNRLASQYVDRVRTRALGGYDAPSNIHQTGAAELIQDMLEAQNMSKPEVEAVMAKIRRAGPSHTKQRLKLDLNQEHPDGNGGTFQLLDLYETDQLKLLRSQAQRVSGEVALARHGVMGKAGLKILRRAMEFGDDGAKATSKELESFDQVSAELLGEPFGSHQGRWLDRAMQANTLARLGGMGFTQFAEYINGISHIGAGRTLQALSGLGRLRSEAVRLSRGEKVENSIIGSLETFGGKEFGTDSYKMVFPFDNPELQYQTFGKDTLTAGDRLLRGATHLQGKLSFWRAIHAAQMRGMAEQIVHKAVRFIREGGDDAALSDMGIDAGLMARLQHELPHIAEFDGSGNLMKFDITKVQDKEAADQFVQAVHRGASQIIQGTFIGETGKWAHEGFLKLLTQFRSFSITSVEKQWARQKGNFGAAKALGIMMGSMAIAAPIYIARVSLMSIGRPDRDAYLEQHLGAGQIAKATLNYIAMSGLAGDFLDAASAVSGIGAQTGGRAGGGSQFVGNLVAPAAGLANDAYKAVQNTKAGTNPHDLLKVLPFNSLPGIGIGINMLGK